MRVNLAHFRTKLGRRIVLLFFLCALLPTAVLAGLSYFVVRSELQKASILRQHQGASAAGQGVFERLQAVESELAFLRTSPFVTEAGRGDGSPAAPENLRRFDALTLVTPTATLPLIGDVSVVPPLDPALRAKLDLGEAVLAVAAGDPGRPLQIFMAKARDPGDMDGGVLWGRVVGDSIWSTAQVYATGIAITEVDFQDATGYCILDPQRRPLDCAGGLASWAPGGPPPEAVIPDDPHHGDLAWGGGDQRYVGHYRHLFMRVGFNSDPWLLVVGESQSSVLQSLADFRKTLIGFLVLTLAVVLFISAAQIRRSMEPLSKLLEGTKSIAAKNFAARIDISSGDEFEEVGRSFNEMAHQVGALVEELQDLSWSTITTLARTIDAKSPWTSGHSERVAQMSVSIARTMGLPPEDLERLHRGGLLHDIGKIGVPIHILDKPTSLTEEEMQAMRDHVTIGARILEPLSAMADVIPIVLYHHERFDGLGYPEGLAGTDIHRLARILCVADTYDALQSDRPYRQGRSIDDSLHVILECSGTQFDPEAVDAFLRLLRSDQEPATLEPLPTRPKLARGA